MKRGPGQPRKHASNAAKQAAYRLRKQAEENERRVVRLLDRLPIPNGMSYPEFARRLRTLAFRKIGELHRQDDQKALKKFKEWTTNIVTTPESL